MRPPAEAATQTPLQRSAASSGPYSLEQIPPSSRLSTPQQQVLQQRKLLTVSSTSRPFRTTRRSIRFNSTSPCRNTGSVNCSRRRSSARHRAVSSWKLNGFNRQSSAPRFRHFTRSSTWLLPVSTSTAVSSNRPRSSARTSVPSFRGRLRSSTIRSGRFAAVCSSAASPSPTHATSWPSSFKPFCRNSPSAASSSTIKTRIHYPQIKFIAAFNQGSRYRSRCDVITLVHHEEVYKNSMQVFAHWISKRELDAGTVDKPGSRSTKTRRLPQTGHPDQLSEH